MESNFQKSTFLETSARGPRTEERLKGEAYCEHGDRKVALLWVVVEHVLINAEIVVYYEVTNSYMPCLGTQVDRDRYRPCNTNYRNNWTVSAPVEFFSLGMTLK